MQDGELRGSIDILLVFSEKLILTSRVELWSSICVVVNLGDFRSLFFQVRFPFSGPVFSLSSVQL
jgi:hypothetical protein